MSAILSINLKLSTQEASMRIAVVMDPIGQINYKKDSTLAMLWAAQERGHQLFYIPQTSLYLDGATPMGLAQTLTVCRDPKNWFSLCDLRAIELQEMDIILMRKDPPFDMNFIYTTYLLERAEELGVLICNKPQSLRDCNEKFFATAFTQCTPPLLVTSNKELLKKFHQQHKDVIFKPLEGMGGSSIFRLKADDPNVSVIIETLTNMGTSPIMAQVYLTEITKGDKRILMVNGEHLGVALARIPAANETRGNLAAGGSYKAIELSERDKWICAQVGPTLRDKGLIFVGLDVIGDYLTEVNVTSPTCIRELDTAFNLDIGGKLIDTLVSLKEQSK
jgi:glutathione synthase